MEPNKKLEDLLAKLFVDDDDEPEELFWPFPFLPDSCPYSYYSSDDE